jgi:hypothetical protein
MTAHPHLLEYLRTFGTGEGGYFRALFTILKSPVEETRVYALKMIGVLLYRNKGSTNYFNHISGFEMISLILAPFPCTLAIGRTLKGMALDEYRYEGAKEQGYRSYTNKNSSQSKYFL